ncbi:leucine-rich repeat-containing protein kinase family protein [Oceanobacter sp. 5_MG-2023]|uniref:leucine-rich repeat-containing protein kinase family protein n=2 Tax=Gammaproteobacteria TaxID=1236 RepID=UPI0026E31E27|nr:leucine-rich repeat-containing protein kinase family protein [Oceanobacter sp. 5_MG-2023]MDO6682382.1 leucine-rich repeat-containing protein kinase family protein [Oceanobacter sp. 5_MG-2023]
MQTLEQLRNGELKGCRHLKLTQALETFPEEIFTLADSLEVLDLSDNQLTALPDDLSRLRHLKILFASNNNFQHFPEGIGGCSALEIVGFKHNQIHHLSETCLPRTLRWLILTDNDIVRLPESIGSLGKLEKLALAGNRIGFLPDSFQQLTQLGLLRISANQLAEFPAVTLTLPKLAWFAFAGNPFCAPRQTHADFPLVDAEALALTETLGRGASGIISRAYWQSLEQQEILQSEQWVAVKVFHGDVTSDGYPEDELDACLSVPAHKNLVTAMARINANNMSALVMELIPAHYQNLGQPPSLQSCTRDTFTQGQRFSSRQVEHMVKQMRSIVSHLEQAEVCHGDLYAHNTLIDAEGNILFGDFGAASRYEYLSAQQKQGIRTIERRALDHFIDDLHGLIP